jgi:phosphoribosylaminoimidazole (AIR) synthetase
MYTRFNCGVGFVLSVNPSKTDELATLLEGEVIGEVTSGEDSRMVIQSIFSQNTLEFE